ncbi:hypothetical protein [Mycobacterium sp. 1274756.6]|uniref:hypothetical protein n=1 Tax=Mycobacterium sp. 1274756.6 TaxID=1834076 RepID=UPI000A94DEB7|nr:hypothetical protein [Mycobacterium sp. 1274756.6]
MRLTLKVRLAAVPLCAAAATIAVAPPARAADDVTYEVVSSSLDSVDAIEYYDGAENRRLDHVTLPWRTNVAIADARSLSNDGAEIRADWRDTIAAPVWQPGKWVTVRIYIDGVLRCQNTLDVGNATCYGSTSFKS